MIEWNIVEGPITFPHACIGCGNGRGPAIATHRNIPGYGDIYVCENCALMAARLFGFAPGKRLEVLSGASKRVTELERENAQKDAKITAAEELERNHMARIRQLEDDLSDITQTNARLRDRIREEAETSLALVGGDAA